MRGPRGGLGGGEACKERQDPLQGASKASWNPLGTITVMMIVTLTVMTDDSASDDKGDDKGDGDYGEDSSEVTQEQGSGAVGNHKNSSVRHDNDINGEGVTGW